MDAVSLVTMYTVIVGLLTLALLIIVWRVSHQRSRYVFVVMLGCVLVILIGFIFEISSATLDERLYWNIVEYFGHIFSPTLVLIFSLFIAQKEKWLSKRYIMPLLGIGTLIFILVATNPLHGLHYTNVTLLQDPVRSFEAERGPVYYMYVTYVFSTMIIAAGVLYANYRKVGLALKRRTMIMELAVLLPLMSMTLLFPLWQYIPAEVMIITGILLSSILLFIGTFGFEMFRMLPFTFDGTVHTLKDGVLIADEFNQILYLNPAMGSILGVVSLSDNIGKHISDLIPGLNVDVKERQGRMTYQEYTELELFEGRFFDVQRSNIYTRSGKNLSCLYIIRDVTNRMRMEEEQRMRMRVVSAFATVSSRLISITPEKIPGVVQEALSSLGGLVKVDRAYLLQYSKDRTTIGVVQSWCAPGISSPVRELQEIPCDHIPWSRAKIQAQEVINIPRVHDLPLKATNERKVLESQGTRSFLGYPLVWADSPQGLVVLESVTRERLWVEEEVRILETFSNVFGQAFDKKIADETIRISEEKFRTLFNNAGDSMFILSREGNIVEVNPQGCERLKKSREELLGANIMSLVTAETAERIPQAIATLFREGSICIEVTSIAKDGTHMISEASARPVQYEGQQAFLMINRDISERKAAESALRLERDRLDVTLNTITDGVLVVDSSHHILLMNRTAEDMLGLSRGQALGSSLEELFPAQRDQEGVISAVERAVRTKSPFTYYRQVLPSAISGDMLINESAAPIYGKGEVIGAIVVLHDVSTEKRLENEMERVERLKSLGILAGGIAHDFNNVLTILMGHHEVMRHDGLSMGEMRARLEESANVLERAKGLAGQLLTFSSGGGPVKRPIQISTLVDEVLKEASLPSSIEVHKSIPGDLMTVDVDNRQMKQALSCVVQNAHESMPGGGNLYISIENVHLDHEGMPDGKYLHLLIRDEGLGIEESNLTHLFEPFFSTKQGRSGMSLAVTHSIIKQHDGDITVESKLGVGTSFHIYLPASSCVHSQEEASTVEACGEWPHEARVLIMDDEDMILEVASEMLHMLGHEASSSHDGAEALKKYIEAKRNGTPFDAVIMDLTIPEGMGGKEAVSRLLQFDPRARVIVSSGYSNDPVMSNYRAFGFVEVMPKPYTLKELEDTISRTLKTNGGLDGATS
ncbi:MAG: PAS domain S-box protein [Methanomassiliicoccus sp.]|nr:PAS domain S-box protein [Methanomassiliicoccus sp.]